MFKTCRKIYYVYLKKKEKSNVDTKLQAEKFWKIWKKITLIQEKFVEIFKNLNFTKHHN